MKESTWYNDAAFMAAAERLEKIPTPSTKHIDETERGNGIATMLSDLRLLAENNGCIAAAWALEFIVTQTLGIKAE
jgi:hypothetical protein